MFKTVCVYCGAEQVVTSKEVEAPQTGEEVRVSHGYCPRCYLRKTLSGLKKHEGAKDPDFVTPEDKQEMKDILRKDIDEGVEWVKDGKSVIDGDTVLEELQQELLLERGEGGEGGRR